MKKPSAKDLQEARDTVSKCFPEGSTVYTITRSVSRSGMQAKISVLQGFEYQKGRFQFFHPSYSVGVLCGFGVDRGFHNAVKVNGCGFDRAQSIVDAIEHALGYKAGALNHEAL